VVSIFFLIRYQTVVASRRLINFARQFFQKGHPGAHDSEQPLSSSYASARARECIWVPSVGAGRARVMPTSDRMGGLVRFQVTGAAAGNPVHAIGRSGRFAILSA